MPSIIGLTVLTCTQNFQLLSNPLVFVITPSPWIYYKSVEEFEQTTIVDILSRRDR